MLPSLGKPVLLLIIKGVSRNAGFKYLVCCSLPMVEAMCTKFSHIFLLSRASIHCASSQQLRFPPF